MIFMKKRKIGCGNILGCASLVATIVIGFETIQISNKANKLNREEQRANENNIKFEKENDYRQNMYAPLNVVKTNGKKKEVNVEFYDNNGVCQKKETMNLPQPALIAKSGFITKSFIFANSSQGMVCYADNNFTNDVGRSSVEKDNYNHRLEDDMLLEPITATQSENNPNEEYFDYYLVVEGLSGKKKIFNVQYVFESYKFKSLNVVPAERVLENKSDTSEESKEIQQIVEYMNENGL